MAKKELLCILVIVCLGGYVYADTKTGYQEENNRNWALDLSNKQKQEFWQNMRCKAKEYFPQDKMKEIISSRLKLKIFVSSSMSISLLKDYIREAANFGGVLVLRGLPNGSMIELISLISEISNFESSVAIQLDDESFEEFGIDNVPAIVLSKQKSILSDEKSEALIYDKVSGNVGIRYALELFAQEGELKDDAVELLKTQN